MFLMNDTHLRVRDAEPPQFQGKSTVKTPMGSIGEPTFKNQRSLQSRTCQYILGEAAGQRAHGKLLAHIDERAGPSAASFPL